MTVASSGIDAVAGKVFPGQEKKTRSKAATLEAPSVLLMGFYGRGNYGDDLMCCSLAEFLIQDGRYRVSVVSSDVNAYQRLANKGVPIVSRGVGSVVSALSKTQILCQGGGTNFHDSYKGKHLFRHWLNLSKWTLLFWIARLKGVQVVVLGAGVGPLRHPISRWITRTAFAACTVIAVRDQASVDELKKISMKIPYESGFDLAALSFSPSVPSAATDRTRRIQRVLGISACSLTPFLRDSALNERYWHTLGDALNCFMQATSVRVVFFSLFTGESSESDDLVIDLIASRLPKGHDYTRHSYQGDVGAYTALFGQCDWFLGTKFHAALAAYIAGCECAIVSYNRKMTDLAKEIGLPPDRRVPADRIQPVEVWLDLLNSFSHEECVPSLLDRTEAKRRAMQAVEAALDRTGGSQVSLEAAANAH
jgi:polysaccharide pyruvyl transferase WcaK-like protein